MRLVTLGYGSALVALGVGGYIASGRASRTALIPAAIGLPVAGLGLLAFVPGLRRPALLGSVSLAALGLAGASRGLGQLPSLLRGTAQRPMAVASQCAMAALSLGYVMAGVRAPRRP